MKYWFGVGVFVVSGGDMRLSPSRLPPSSHFPSFVFCFRARKYIRKCLINMLWLGQTMFCGAKWPQSGHGTTVDNIGSCCFAFNIYISPAGIARNFALVRASTVICATWRSKDEPTRFMYAAFAFRALTCRGNKVSTQTSEAKIESELWRSHCNL